MKTAYVLIFRDPDFRADLEFCTHEVPCDSAGKESACNAWDLGLIPGLGRSPGEGKGYPLQYSGLENSMDYSPWCWKELNTTEQLSLILLVGMQTSIATMENNVDIPLKTGNRTAIWPSNPTAGHTHWGNQKGKRHVYPNVHRSTVHNSQDMEAT